MNLRGIVVCGTAGSVGAIALISAGRFWLPAMMCAGIAAFGAYSAVVHPALGARRLSPDTQRVLRTLLSGVAGVAALAVGLLALAGVFGGSIEVMRR